MTSVNGCTLIDRSKSQPEATFEDFECAFHSHTSDVVLYAQQRRLERQESIVHHLKPVGNSSELIRS